MNQVTHNQSEGKLWNIEINRLNKRIIITMDDDATIDIDSIQDMVDIQNSAGIDTNLFNRLIISGEYATLTAAARKYLQTHEVPVRKEAFVIASLAQKIILNFYLRFRPNNHPCKAFKTREEAEKWLAS
jgi:hypothetical protein